MLPEESRTSANFNVAHPEAAFSGCTGQQLVAFSLRTRVTIT